MSTVKINRRVADKTAAHLTRTCTPPLSFLAVHRSRQDHGVRPPTPPRRVHFFALFAVIPHTCFVSEKLTKLTVPPRTAIASSAEALAIPIASGPTRTLKYSCLSNGKSFSVTHHTSRQDDTKKQNPKRSVKHARSCLTRGRSSHRGRSKTSRKSEVLPLGIPVSLFGEAGYWNRSMYYQYICTG